jgi:hypothetical protein
MKEAMRKENIAEDQLKRLFNGLRGIVLLDTLGRPDDLRAEVERVDTGLCILEIRQVGLENTRKVIDEAIERSRQKRKRTSR